MKHRLLFYETLGLESEIYKENLESRTYQNISYKQATCKILDLTILNTREKIGLPESLVDMFVQRFIQQDHVYLSRLSLIRIFVENVPHYLKALFII